MAEKKFLDFLDRFDGGGMGKSGEKFEGGGLLSMLGNLLADPYGSDDKARMASRNAFYNAQGDAVPAPSLLAPRAGGRTAPAATNNNQTAAARPAPPTDAQRFGMNPPAPYSASPVNVGAPPSYTQPNSMKTPVNYSDGSGMTPVNNYPDSFANDSFTYSGDRNDGMMGLIPTKTNRYDFVDNLPDDARDFKNINLQGSGMTPNNNYLDPRKLFAAEVAKFAGISPQEAETAINAGGFDQAYQAFVANNYKLPNS